MPFVKRQRTYYKDGVEVPAESITDFGRTAYYKNIVTTKYWKEVTTGSKELEYAAYGSSFIEYAKVPINLNSTLYYVKEPYGGVATSSSELTQDVMSTIVSISESTLTTKTYLGETTDNRNTACDLYKDTTVTEIVEGTPEDYTYTTEEVVPVEVTADDEYDYTEFIPSTQFDTYTDTDKLYQLATKKRTYYKYGTEPNASIVGSPTIVDGVASGFDASNYLTLPEVFNPKSNPWEFVVKIKTPTAFSTYNCVWGTIGTFKDGLQFVGNKIYLYLSSNGSSWDITGTSLASTVTFNTDTTYYFKTYFTGTEYRVDYKTENGEYINCIKLSSSTPIFSTTSHYMGLGTNRGNTAWLGDGSIDLTQSYIKINGKDWWHGTKSYQINVGSEDIWADWTQPVATAATTAITGGNMVITASSTESSRKIYGALDGDVSTWSNAWLSSSSGAAWWQVKFPYKIKITGLTHYNPYVDASCAITSAQFFTSSSKTTPIGNSFSTPNTDWYKTVISGIPSEGIVTDTIYFSGIGGGYAGIGELVITAQKQLPAGETTSTDYDYYEDKLTSYALALKRLLNYYRYEKQRDTGTYTFTLDKEYEASLLFVGNGGGGCSSQKDSQWHYSGGGSGACFEGVVRLPADTYTLTIGSLGYGNNRDNVHYHSSGVVSTDSYLTNSAGVELIRVGAGGNGYTSVGGVSGAAGVLTMGALDVVETKKARNGNTQVGKTASTNYSLSAYDGTATGYGAGTGAERGEGNVYGVKGIFKLGIITKKEGIRSY